MLGWTVGVIIVRIVQATTADGFKLALIDLDKTLAGQDAEIVHIMHDEIIVQAREDVADHVAAVAKECMEPDLCRDFSRGAICRKSRDWGYVGLMIFKKPSKYRIGVISGSRISLVGYDRNHPYSSFLI